MTGIEKFMEMYEKFLDELEIMRRTWTSNEHLENLSHKVKRLEERLERKGIDIEALKLKVALKKSN